MLQNYSDILQFDVYKIWIMLPIFERFLFFLYLCVIFANETILCEAMNSLFYANDIATYSEWIGAETRNPLVGLIDFSKVKPLHPTRKLYGFYAVFLGVGKCGKIRYGMNDYNYQKGDLMFVAPGQVFGADDDGVAFQPSGFLLMFHPDLVRSTSLENVIRKYPYFSYEMNDALHISQEERLIVMDCFRRIGYELNHPVDEHSWELIIDGIKTLLDYCNRFYGDQFTTCKVQDADVDILLKFENLLDDYFHSGKAKMKGMPTVQYCADEFRVSPTYFSDMLKKETGRTAKFFINAKTIELAKTALVSSKNTVNEIAWSLGFQYSQHFTRWFKKSVGCTPNEFRVHIGCQ